MELLCPSCQRKLTIPDNFAGQMAKCPMCNNTFTAPELPATPAAAFTPTPSPLTPPLAPAVGAGLPSPQIVPALTPTPVIAPTPSESLPTPPPVQVSPSVATDDVGSATPPPMPGVSPQEMVSAKPAASMPVTPRVDVTPQAAPGEHAHRWSVHINPHVLRWVVVAAVVALFVLSFFPWVGRYPGGVSAATQSAWQAAFGSESVDEDVKMPANVRFGSDLANTAGASGLMILYVLLLVLSLLLVVAVAVWDLLPLKLPAALERLRPWRWGIVAAIASLGFLVLVFQEVSGFSLENRVTDAVDSYLKERQQHATGPNATPVMVKNLAVKRGLCLSQLHRTAALDWATALNLLAVLCALLVFWADRRGARPLPSVDVLW